MGVHLPVGYLDRLLSLRMQSAKPKVVRYLISAVRVLLMLIALYVGAYFILMSRSEPAVSDSGKAESWIAARSSFRWAQQNGEPL